MTRISFQTIKQRVISEVIGNYSTKGVNSLDAPRNIRAGSQIRGSHQSLAIDVANDVSVQNQDDDALPKSAVVLLTKGDKVLAVSRGENLNDMNMPGGHVELNEDSQDAAVRELWEETGIKADEIYSLYSKPDNGYLVTVYRVTRYHGNLKDSSEGSASWQSPDVLKSSSFGKFFEDMLASIPGDYISSKHDQ